MRLPKLEIKGQTKAVSKIEIGPAPFKQFLHIKRRASLRRLQTGKP